jgi:hypothetical protein
MRSSRNGIRRRGHGKSVRVPQTSQLPLEPPDVMLKARDLPAKCTVVRGWLWGKVAKVARLVMLVMLVMRRRRAIGHDAGIGSQSFTFHQRKDPLLKRKGEANESGHRSS